MTTDAGTPTPLRQAMIAFDDFLNEPPEYEGDRTVRWYRHEAYRKWVPVQTALTAAEAERDKARDDSRKWCDDFTKLEPELRRMVEFSKQCVNERNALRARVAGLEEWMRNNLDDYAEASSGYIPGCGSDLQWRARHDEAVAEARALLAPSSEPQP